MNLLIFQTLTTIISSPIKSSNYVCRISFIQATAVLLMSLNLSFPLQSNYIFVESMDIPKLLNFLVFSWDFIFRRAFILSSMSVSVKFSNLSSFDVLVSQETLRRFAQIYWLIWGQPCSHVSRWNLLTEMGTVLCYLDEKQCRVYDQQQFTLTLAFSVKSNVFSCPQWKCVSVINIYITTKHATSCYTSCFIH